MAKGGDVILAALVLIAAGLVLSAPLLGRSGFPIAANVVVCAAAASGVAAFLLAAAHSLLGVRKVEKRVPGKEPRC